MTMNSLKKTFDTYEVVGDYAVFGFRKIILSFRDIYTLNS